MFLSLSFLFLPCVLPFFCSNFTPSPPLSLPLCSTVFIPLQPPCFRGAVSVVDKMKTGRIHYLALHSSHRLWFALPTSPLSSLFLSTIGTFFHRSVFFVFSLLSLSLSCFVLLQFFPPWLGFTLFLVLQHAPVSQ